MAATQASQPSVQVTQATSLGGGTPVPVNTGDMQKSPSIQRNAFNSSLQVQPIIGVGVVKARNDIEAFKRAKADVQKAFADGQKATAQIEALLNASTNENDRLVQEVDRLSHQTMTYQHRVQQLAMDKNLLLTEKDQMMQQMQQMMSNLSQQQVAMGALQMQFDQLQMQMQQRAHQNHQNQAAYMLYQQPGGWQQHSYQQSSPMSPAYAHSPYLTAIHPQYTHTIVATPTAGGTAVPIVPAVAAVPAVTPAVAVATAPVLATATALNSNSVIPVTAAEDRAISPMTLMTAAVAGSMNAVLSPVGSGSVSGSVEVVNPTVVPVLPQSGSVEGVPILSKSESAVKVPPLAPVVSTAAVANAPLDLPLLANNKNSKNDDKDKKTTPVVVTKKKDLLAECVAASNAAGGVMDVGGNGGNENQKENEYPLLPATTFATANTTNTAAASSGLTNTKSPQKMHKTAWNPQAPSPIIRAPAAAAAAASNSTAAAALKTKNEDSSFVTTTPNGCFFVPTVLVNIDAKMTPLYEQDDASKAVEHGACCQQMHCMDINQRRFIVCEECGMNGHPSNLCGHWTTVCDACDKKGHTSASIVCPMKKSNLTFYYRLYFTKDGHCIGHEVMQMTDDVQDYKLFLRRFTDSEVRKYDADTGIEVMNVHRSAFTQLCGKGYALCAAKSSFELIALGQPVKKHTA